MSHLKTAQQFVNSIPSAALCVDQDLVIQTVNKAFSKLFGSVTQPANGTPLGQLLFADTYSLDCESPNQQLQQLLSEKKARTHLSLVTANQEKVNVSALIKHIKIEELSDFNLIILEPISEQRDAHKLSLYMELFDHLNQGVFISVFNKESTGRHGQFIEVNNHACQQLGYQRKELLQLNARTLNPTGNTETIKAIGRNLKRDGKAHFNAIHLGKDGKHHPVKVLAQLMTVDDSSYILSLCDYNTEDENESDIEQTRFGRLMDLSWDEIYVFGIDSLVINQANTGALDNLGYSKHEINQLKITDLLQDISETTFKRLTKSLFEGNKSQIVLESVFKRKDETEYPVEIRLQLSHSEVPPVYLANIQNISDRKETEKNLIFLANHDALTGLFNRNMFIRKLNDCLEQCKRSDTLMAVFFLDLDGFKYINDTMGHDTGDELIKETAKRLCASVRNTDTVSRLGGDEFTVILTNLKHIDDISIVADKIIKNISIPCTIDEHKIKTSCSLGITVYPFEDADNAYTLIKQADTAMYQAKASGKNKYSFYAASLAKEAMNLKQLEADLVNAFQKKEFEVFFQSKVNLNDRKIIGAEALIRWPNDKYPGISPAEFIPIMEKTDLIKAIDLWVFKETCINLKKWLPIKSDLVVSINLSAKHFNDKSVIHDIKNILSETDVSAKNLEIEITEGVLISKTEKAEIILNELKQEGFHISLDDFGSGYSSLSYLKQLPINRLKIDRSFVIDLDKNKDSQAIIKAIINLANSLDLSVIAEGIETEHQANILSELQCDEGQGYLFSKPCPAKDYFKLLETDYK